MIAAKGLSKNFGEHRAVEALDFHVPAGALCALLGPNGAGKTTTVRLLLGLLTPTEGRAEVAGVSLPAADAAAARLRARAGFLTESPGFYDKVNGRENLEIFARLYGLTGVDLSRRVEHWLRRMDLWEARDRPFATWSKGMKQRLALIRAVIHEPEVIFLDEPTAGLDPAASREVRDLIAGFRREGRTILLCTHNLAEAAELADLVGILRRRMLAFGAPGTLSSVRPEVEITLSVDAAPMARLLGGMAGVDECRAEGSILRCTLVDIVRDTPHVVRTLVGLGADLLSVRPRVPSLEEIYLRAVREDHS
ncbi:MAG: ABC transporter ATP-binding protein [Gemmatimonadales bacterium]|nr:ABC transporter ATP-binding protein [Gemmatimonadales bacterium]